MNDNLLKLLQALECEYLITSGWVCVEENTWDHHVWTHPSSSIHESHNSALKIQKRRDGEY